MALFKKKVEAPKSTIDFEDLEFHLVHDSSKIYDYAEKIMHRIPVVFNFTDCLITEANEVLIFLTGVLYACDGEIVKIQDKIYLMAQKHDLAGPVLQKFVNEFGSKK